MSYISVKRVEEITGFKEKTLYSWAETGRMPSYKVNGKRVFVEKEVLEWVNSCREDVRKSILKPLRPTAPERTR